MAAEVRVPGVAVDQVDAFAPAAIAQVDRHGLQRRELGRRAGQLAPGTVGDDGGRAPAAGRRPRQWTVDVDQAGELAGQVLDVHAGAAVDVRRVLAGQDRSADG